MKTLTAILVFVTALVTMASGQSNKQHSELKEDEVPSSVRSNFKKNFSNVSSDGTWTVFYTAAREGNRTVARPLYYNYTLKSDSKSKAEISFEPDGTLRFVKGIQQSSEKAVILNKTETDTGS